jgi:hypothetical protein
MRSSRPHGSQFVPDGERSWHCEESQDLVHDSSTLVRLEKKLSVRETIQND